MAQTKDQAIQRIIDRAEIQDALYRYARGVDRSDWELVRSTYHPDAYDDHSQYKGDIDGFIAWLKPTFPDADNGMHFLGNCLIEFASADLAMVETYFVSQRLLPAGATPDDRKCRHSWGRYVDRFERRNGEWRVAHRTVVLDAVMTSSVQGGVRTGPAQWGKRGHADRLYELQTEIFGGGVSTRKPD